MPSRKGNVSQRRSISQRRKKRKQRSRDEFEHSYSSQKTDCPTVPEVAINDNDLGWKAAWSGFFIDDDQVENATDDPNLSSEYQEPVDSDNCAADKLYVILHKVFEYSHKDDLDIFVKKLRSERIYSKYILLQNSVNDNRSDFNTLVYMNADDHGLHFLDVYRHKVPLSFKLELIINTHLKPILFVHGQKMNEDHDFWIGLPKSIFTVRDILKIISKLSSWDICIGNPESEYVSMLPVGVSLYETTSPKPVAYREDICARRGSVEYTSTIRSSRCSMFLPSTTRCKQCQLYRNTLRKKLSRKKNQRTPDTFTLKSTPHKSMSKDNLVKKMQIIKDEKKSVLGELERLKRKVSNIIKSKGQLLSQSENEELLELLEEHKEDVEQSPW